MRGSKYKYAMTLFLVYLYIYFQTIKNRLSLDVLFESSAIKDGDGLIMYTSPDPNGEFGGGGNYRSFDKLPASTTTTTPSTMQALIQELEQQVTTNRYYVYDDPNMTLPVVRQKALQNSKPWEWRQNWGHRFADYARGEIRWLQALESHPMRTNNASEADFFIVPIPVGATFFWKSGRGEKEKTERVRAFRQLLQHPLFQNYPEKHVSAFATTEKLFTNYWGLSKDELKQFKPTTVIRDSDQNALTQWPHRQDISISVKTSLDRQQFSHLVALGFPVDGVYQPVTVKQWHQKTYWFFYHSRESGSLCNSTIFRHALLPNSFLHEKYQRHENQQNATKKNESMAMVPLAQPFLSIPQRFHHQPVTIGYDIPADQWTREFLDSKFCLVIRGDQPASRSMVRAIRAGCMPLIVSDYLPAFQPLYSKTIQYNEFAVIVKEDDFIKDPIRSLDGAVSSLSNDDLQRKLEGLRLMQRIVACDKPDSLFVPAFAREIVHAMNK